MINGICDIHSHILPGVDDGAVDINEASKMLSIAYDEGIRHVIATPHFIADGCGISMNALYNSFSMIKREAYKISPDMKIYLGHELFHSKDILYLLNRGEALTINGTRYILIEFFPGVSFKELWNNLHTYLLYGYSPILAHAERYYELTNKPALAGELVRSGIYIQINISSLVGHNTRTCLCNKLINRGWVHFVGTDAHGAISRPPYIKEGAELVRKRFGEKTFKMLFWSNPIAMLEGRIIDAW